MKSLLHKTLSQFLVCTVAIFILATPLFFLLTKYFYAEDMIDIIEAVQLGTSIPHIDLERDIMVGMMLQFLLIFLVLSLALFIMMRFITHTCGCRLMIRCRRQNSSTWRKVQCLSFRKPK